MNLRKSAVAYQEAEFHKKTVCSDTIILAILQL